MKLYVLTINGAPYKAFTDFDVASDFMVANQKNYPWFIWAVIAMGVNTSVHPTPSAV